MNRVTINGKVIEAPDGASISIVNGDVFIGGNQVLRSVDNELRIKVEGTLASLTVDRGSVECQNVGGNVQAGGSVNCENVAGYVTADGSVNCGNVGGDLKADGSVCCGKVGGKITAGGSVMAG